MLLAPVRYPTMVTSAASPETCLLRLVVEAPYNLQYFLATTWRLRSDTATQEGNPSEQAASGKPSGQRQRTQERQTDGRQDGNRKRRKGGANGWKQTTGNRLWWETEETGLYAEPPPWVLALSGAGRFPLPPAPQARACRCSILICHTHCEDKRETCREAMRSEQREHYCSLE